MLETWELCRVDIAYEYQTIKDLLTTQVQVQDILSDYSQEMFLPVPVAKNLMTLVDNFLHLYTLLANRADREREFLWNVTPKFHWHWHWAQKSIFLNPRRGNCSLDEDYVGQMKKCVAACTPGTAMEDVPSKVMERQVWAQHFNNKA